MAFDPTRRHRDPDRDRWARCPRPATLQEAYADYDAGKIEQGRLSRRSRTPRSRTRSSAYEATGSPIISDGEQRWSSLRDLPDHRHARRHRAGADASAAGGQFFAIFADGHGRQLPQLDRRAVPLHHLRGRHADEVDRLRDRPMKQAVIAPSMLALLYPLKDPVDGYPRGRVRGRRWSTSARRTSARRSPPGAARVSVDFTEGRLATRDDPRNPWTGRRTAAALHRADQPRDGPLHAPRSGANIGVHTCPGGDRDSVHSADVPYNEPAAGRCSTINAGYFLIQLASERDKDPVYESIGKNLRDDADGRRADGLHRRDQPGQPAGRERAGGRRPADPGRELHPEGAARLDRRLRVLAVLDRREAQPRLARLRPRHRVPEDHATGSRARGLAAEKLGIG